VIVNSLPASSTTAATVAAEAATANQQQQQAQQRTSNGGNQSIMLDKSSSDVSNNGRQEAPPQVVKFSPDFRNQLYESLDAVSLAAHGILGKEPAASEPVAFTKTRRSADGLYGGPQQAAPHVADFGIYENRKTTCLLYLQVSPWLNLILIVLWVVQSSSKLLLLIMFSLLYFFHLCNRESIMRFLTCSFFHQKVAIRPPVNI
jgi:hypothetical protein